MGEFLYVSAIRDRTEEEVDTGIRAYAAQFGVEALETGGNEFDEEIDVSIFAPRNNWTVVLWPNMFFEHDVAICRELSRSLSTLVSHINIYDGDHWYHFLLRNGEMLDRFSSWPGYFVTTAAEKEQERLEWRGNAEIIASHVGVSAEVIRPYLMDVSLLPPPPRKGMMKRALRWLGWAPQFDPDELTPKAYPNDEHELGDVWVFVDFWRRLGISYAGAPGDRETRIRFPSGFHRLPSEDL